jgi:hypothetical protein
MIGGMPWNSDRLSTPLIKYGIPVLSLKWVSKMEQRVRVSFRRLSETGTKMDADGNRYDGLGPNEDEWIDILSCRIQKPDKMAR